MDLEDLKPHRDILKVTLIKKILNQYNFNAIYKNRKIIVGVSMKILLFIFVLNFKKEKKSFRIDENLN